MSSQQGPRVDAEQAETKPRSGTEGQPPGGWRGGVAWFPLLQWVPCLPVPCLPQSSSGSFCPLPGEVPDPAGWPAGQVPMWLWTPLATACLCSSRPGSEMGEVIKKANGDRACMLGKQCPQERGCVWAARV